MLDGVGTFAVAGVVATLVLVVAAQLVVRTVVRLARYYDLSEAVIGLTVLSVGTSLPEIVSHIVASTRIAFGLGDPRIISATVLGGNIGSDVVQQTLVLGLVVLAVGGFQFSPAFLRRGYAPMIGTTLLTLVLAWDGMLTRVDGLVLVSLFLAYTGFLYTTRRDIIQQQAVHPPSVAPRRDAAIGTVALLVVIIAAHALFEMVGVIVSQTGIEGSLLGVVVLGIGAASPEMTTAIVGLREGAEGLSLGTLIGSNITNPLLGIGIGSLLSTYHVPQPLIYWDLPMETVTAAVLLTYLLTKDDAGAVLSRVGARFGHQSLTDRLSAVEERYLGRIGAMLLICLYVVYLLVRITHFPQDF